MTDTYTTRLTAPGYALYLYAAPPLTVAFLTRNWGAGMTAATAARLLADHGYVAPAAVRDDLHGRALGHQSTLRYASELHWEKPVCPSP